MGPKFKLQINVAPEPEPVVSNANPLGQSLQINGTGSLVCMDGIHAFGFGPEGISKKDAENGELGAHYMISERDIRQTKKLGAGASSTVHKGFLFKENKFVAIKKISVFERDLRHQMLNDIKALIDTPNLPGLIQFFGAYHVVDSGQISIVLEYMDGGSLADVLLKVKQIPEDVLSKLTAKILVGLMYLHKHKHMVHRDIKPANILINLEGEPKITDFGISAFIDSTLAVCNTFLGTVTYMSPERINAQTYSTPADIWSLGLALVECATGKYPYDASVGPLQLMIQVLEADLPIPPSGEYSEEFRDFCTQCMQKDPFLRPSAETLLKHPYITKYADVNIDLRSFMQCVFDPHDKLDEIAIVFAWNYYAIQSAGIERLADLAMLYSDGSVFTHNGEKAQGRAAIIQKLHREAERHAGLKVVHHVVHVDCQPLGTDGSALVHVQGQLLLPGLLGQAPGAGAIFAECFVLCQIQQGEYFVRSQNYRTLQ